MLRIALAQVNATVGDLDGNAGLIVEWTRRAAARGAKVVVFPEMMLTGYPVEDLALRASFVEASIAALHGVASRLAAEGLGGIAVVTGYLDRRAGMAPRTGLPAGAPLDAAALLHSGRVVITSAKHHLPNYGVFDEFRYFVPGDTLPVFRLPANASEKRRDRHRDLRGPVAGRRAGGRVQAGRGGPARGAERVALRAGQGRPAARAVRAARPRGGRRAGLRQHDRRAGRAGLRRRLDPGRGRRRPAGPRTAVRGGTGHRRPGPAGPRRPRRPRTSRWTRATAR